MNKNGFTLIELLAVIVILSIIALIATPIILGIINDAKEESNKRSIDLYADSIKKAIITKEMKDLKGIVPGAYNSEELKTKLDVSVEYEGNRVECDTVELYEDGRVYIANCKVNDEAIEYTYGEQQEILAEFDKVCTPVTQTKMGNIPAGNYEPGDEYMCKVNNEKTYKFYVLSKEGNKVNLILESNITKSGNLIIKPLPTNATEEQMGHVFWSYQSIFEKYGGTLEEWNADVRIHRFGPIAPIITLKEATSTWTNLSALIVKDFEDCDEASGTCVKKPMAETFISNSRLPYYSEVTTAGCSDAKDSCPGWLYDYMDHEPDSTKYLNITEIKNINCYWTGSSNLESGVFAIESYNRTSYYSYCGVRPVITLKI